MLQSGKRVRSEQLLERQEDIKRKLVDNGCNNGCSNGCSGPPILYGDLFIDEGSSNQFNVNKQKSLLPVGEDIEELSQAYFNDDIDEVNNSKDDATEVRSMYESVMDMPLLSQNIYFLNKSHSKWVCVGLDINLYYEPVIRIVGLKKQSITMNLEQWKKFVISKLRIMSCFNKSNPVYSVFKIGDIKISYDCFDGVNKILKMEKHGECLYISHEGLIELWHIIELINIRIENLKVLDYGKYYKNFIERLSMMEGDVKTNMENLIEGLKSESVCITKELMTYGLKKIMFDLQFYKATIIQ